MAEHVSPLAARILTELEMRELYEQITVRENSGCIEIKHPLCGHLTVYRPRRDDLASNRSDAPVILPGYINASSWQTAGLSPKTAKEVYTGMMLYLRIMDIAVESLDKYNSILTDWPEFTNPFDDADRLRMANQTLEAMRVELEQRRAAKSGKKKGGK
jgi:hypothetical protein